MQEWYGKDLDVDVALRSLGFSFGRYQQPEREPSYDAVVVGAGVVGLCFARDLAYLGYRVAVIERKDSIGGVWADNEYPGLRLHGPGATY